MCLGLLKDTHILKLDALTFGLFVLFLVLCAVHVTQKVWVGAGGVEPLSTHGQSIYSLLTHAYHIFRLPREVVRHYLRGNALTLGPYVRALVKMENNPPEASVTGCSA